MELVIGLGSRPVEVEVLHLDPRLGAAESLRCAEAGLTQSP